MSISGLLYFAQLAIVNHIRLNMIVSIVDSVGELDPANTGLDRAKIPAAKWEDFPNLANFAHTTKDDVGELCRTGESGD